MNELQKKTEIKNHFSLLQHKFGTETSFVGALPHQEVQVAELQRDTEKPTEIMQPQVAKEN